MVFSAAFFKEVIQLKRIEHVGSSYCSFFTDHYHPSLIIFCTQY